METEMYKDHKIEIDFDEMPDSPREGYDLGTIVTSGRSRYNIGDEQPMDFEDHMKGVRREPGIILPVYAYIHGGMTISLSPFSCPWDSGQVGFICVTNRKIRNEFGVSRVTKKVMDRVEKILESEISVFDDYLTGNVYRFRIIDQEGIEQDSFGSFYGSDHKHNGLLDMAEESIDSIVG